MSIIITISESTSQIISGIPEYITIDTNITSVVLYTLDGTDPTTESDIVTDNKLYLPTDQVSVSLKILAISGDDYSDIFEHEWSTEVNFLSKRFEETDGINILPPGSSIVDNLSKDYNGDSAQNTSIAFQDLEMLTSDRDKYKKYENGKTALRFVNFNLELILSEEIYQGKTSSPNSNVSFDPKAGLIIIDGSTEENMRAQIVKIINRPTNTMATRSDSYNEHLQSNSILTGNLVKYYINPNTGKIVFYYFDSRECRWIQSIQKITPKILNIGQQVGNPKVFSWIQDPVMSKIF